VLGREVHNVTAVLAAISRWSLECARPLGFKLESKAERHRQEARRTVFSHVLLPWRARFVPVRLFGSRQWRVELLLSRFAAKLLCSQRLSFGPPHSCSARDARSRRSQDSVAAPRRPQKMGPAASTLGPAGRQVEMIDLRALVFPRNTRTVL